MTIKEFAQVLDTGDQDIINMYIQNTDFRDFKNKWLFGGTNDYFVYCLTRQHNFALKCIMEKYKIPLQSLHIKYLTPDVFKWIVDNGGKIEMGITQELFDMNKMYYITFLFSLASTTEYFAQRKQTRFEFSNGPTDLYKLYIIYGFDTLALFHHSIRDSQSFSTMSRLLICGTPCTKYINFDITPDIYTIVLCMYWSNCTWDEVVKNNPLARYFMNALEREKYRLGIGKNVYSLIQEEFLNVSKWDLL